MRTQKLLTLLAVSVIACGLFTGCAAMRKIDTAFFTPTAYATNHVAEHTELVPTNRTVVVTATNAAGEVTSVTNKEHITIQIVVPAHDEVKAVAWKPNESTTTTVSSLANFVPGYGTIAGWGFTALMGIAAALRSRNYKAALVSTAQGVEHFVSQMDAKGQGTVGASLIDTLKTVHDDAGVRQTVDAVLRNDVGIVPIVKI